VEPLLTESHNSDADLARGRLAASTELKLRVVLVDDHELVRAGIKALLAPHESIEVVGEASDGFAAIEVVERLQPDVVVMDVSLPKLGGAEATEQIKKAQPNVKVLALSAHEERASVQLFLEVGASGYVLKRAAVDELVRAIRTVATGSTYLDPALAGDVLRRRRRGRSGVVVELSEREADVLRHIALGRAAKDIAASMAVSGRTVETYKNRAMVKLGLKTRADVVRYAVQRGWLRSGSEPPPSQ
jgi:DNA-binding NarL/FixJ family response regulator